MKYSSLKDIDEIGVSHNPEIKKKILIKNGQVPHLTQFSKAIFKTGQIADGHTHKNMYEIFNVESGRGEIIVNDAKYSLNKGVCVTVDPGEKHKVINTGEGNLILTMIGIEV